MPLLSAKMPSSYILASVSQKLHVQDVIQEADLLHVLNASFARIPDKDEMFFKLDNISLNSLNSILDQK